MNRIQQILNFIRKSSHGCMLKLFNDVLQFYLDLYFFKKSTMKFFTYFHKSKKSISPLHGAEDLQYYPYIYVTVLIINVHLIFSIMHRLSAK